MQNEMELLKRIEGKDEMGMPKAACSVSVQNEVPEQEPEIMESAFTMDAEVFFHITEVWAVVDIHFENRLNYDLFQFLQICKDYTELVRGNTATDEQPPMLVLSIAPLGEYEQFVIGRNGFWSLMAQELESCCDTIRFIFPRQWFGAYELTEETVEKMIEETEKEVNGFFSN